MVLPLDDRKLLPLGIHDASLKEVEEAFGRFQRSDRRPELFRKLSDYIKALRQAEIRGSLILDGSFVMACVDEPGDIDLILVLPTDWDWSADVKPYQYNVVSKRRVRRNFGFDVFVVSVGSADEMEWRRFFSGVDTKWCKLFGWPLDSKKGLPRVQL
jgi:hypothetical protein